MNSASTLVSQFMSTAGEVDKESMRLAILDTMGRNLAWSRYLLANPLYVEHWKNLKDYILFHPELERHESLEAAIADIENLPEMIEGWIRDNLDSSEQLEFSVTSKAAELSTGNELQDYFLAVKIRHDQLIAANEIIGEAVIAISKLVECPDAAAILAMNEWKFFQDLRVSDRIFVFAEQLYEVRELSVDRD